MELRRPDHIDTEINDENLHSYVLRHKKEVSAHYSVPALPLSPEEIELYGLQREDRDTGTIYRNDTHEFHVDENGFIKVMRVREDDVTSVESFEYDEQGYITKHDMRSVRDKRPAGEGVYIQHFYETHGGGDKKLAEMYFTYYNVNPRLMPNQLDSSRPPVRVFFDRT